MKHWIIKIISVVEIIGGTIGCLLTISYFNSVFSTEQVVLIPIVIGIVFFALYVVSILAGYWLWKEKKVGYRLSVITQSLQIVFFWSKIISYRFVSGLLAGISINSQGLNLDYHAGSIFTFQLLIKQSNLSLGINFIPVIFIYLLYKHKSKMNI